MPELPEVETMRCGILPIVGGRVLRLHRPRSSLRPIELVPRLSEFRRRITGKAITAVGRLGKRVLIELDSGDRIVIEPRMTGRILLADPPDRTHLRLILELADVPACRLMFWDVRGLGQVRLLSPDEFARRLGPERIGPDAMEISEEQLRQRLQTSRRAIKVALLDQRALAGIGNLYASEILHNAGIHPQRTCDRLRPDHWKALHRSIREVLAEAIRCQGSTLADGSYRTPLDAAGGFQDQHRVYQRHGQLCLRCGRNTIVRLVQAQRSTFFCPGCQPHPGTSKRTG